MTMGVWDPQVSSKLALCSGFSSLSLVLPCPFPSICCFLSSNSQSPTPCRSGPSCLCLHLCGLARARVLRWELWADSSISPSLLGFCHTPTFTYFPIWHRTHFHFILPPDIFLGIYEMQETRVNGLPPSSANEWCKGTWWLHGLLCCRRVRV